MRVQMCSPAAGPQQYRTIVSFSCAAWPWEHECCVFRAVQWPALGPNAQVSFVNRLLCPAAVTPAPPLVWLRQAPGRNLHACMQDRMHLDCVFSILGDDCCLMLKEMMGQASPTCRLVDEFTQDVVSNTWTLSRERVEFASYMRDNGFHIIEIEGADQLVRARRNATSASFCSQHRFVPFTRIASCRLSTLRYCGFSRM